MDEKIRLTSIILILHAKFQEKMLNFTSPRRSIDLVDSYGSFYSFAQNNLLQDDGKEKQFKDICLALMKLNLDGIKDFEPPLSSFIVDFSQELILSEQDISKLQLLPEILKNYPEIQIKYPETLGFILEYQATIYAQMEDNQTAGELFEKSGQEFLSILKRRSFPSYSQKGIFAFMQAQYGCALSCYRMENLSSVLALLQTYETELMTLEETLDNSIQEILAFEIENIRKSMRYLKLELTPKGEKIDQLRRMVLSFNQRLVDGEVVPVYEFLNWIKNNHPANYDKLPENLILLESLNSYLNINCYSIDEALQILDDIIPNLTPDINSFKLKRHFYSNILTEISNQTNIALKVSDSKVMVTLLEILYSNIKILEKMKGEGIISLYKQRGDVSRYVIGKLIHLYKQTPIIPDEKKIALKRFMKLILSEVLAPTFELLKFGMQPEILCQGGLDPTAYTDIKDYLIDKTLGQKAQFFFDQLILSLDNCRMKEHEIKHFQTKYKDKDFSIVHVYINSLKKAFEHELNARLPNWTALSPETREKFERIPFLLTEELEKAENRLLLFNLFPIFELELRIRLVDNFLETHSDFTENIISSESLSIFKWFWYRDNDMKQKRRKKEGPEIGVVTKVLKNCISYKLQYEEEEFIERYLNHVKNVVRISDMQELKKFQKDIEKVGYSRNDFFHGREISSKTVNDRIEKIFDFLRKVTTTD